jgi:hypothetical protein
MSRNLCQTNCDGCGYDGVELLEAPRPIRADECGPYFPEYEGMLVANAECVYCAAKYLAWVNETTRKNKMHYRDWRYPGKEPWDDKPFVDLSWRAAFNDEPAEEDLPEYDVKPQRVGPYTGRLLAYRRDP